MDRPPEPPDGPKPADRPAVRVTSIQQFESPDAAEASVMADQRTADQAGTNEETAAPRGSARVESDSSPGTPHAPQEVARGSASVPGTWPPVRAESARGTARVRPMTPSGPEAGRPVRVDVQTSSGVPARPIRDAAPAPAPAAEGKSDTKPVAKTPVVEGKSDTNPVNEPPVAERPPADEGPAAGEPVAKAPAIEKPPADDQPAAEEPAAEESVADEPVAEIKPAAKVAETPAAEPTSGAKPADGPDAGREQKAGTAPAEEPTAGAEVVDRPTGPVRTAIALPAGPARAETEPAPGSTAKPAPAGNAEKRQAIPMPPGPARKEAEENEAEETRVIERPAAAQDPDETAVIERPKADTAPARATPAEATPEKKPATVSPPPADPAPAAIPGEETQVIRQDETRTRKIVVVPGRGERTVSIPVASRPEQPPQPEVDRRRTPRGGPFDLGHAPAVLLLSSFGVLLVALAYTGGREGTSWGTTAYWIGQVVVFTPVVLRLLSRRMAGVAESFLLVMGLAVNQYLLKWMYSPDQFRFPDELQHWLATTTIMETGELFRPNLALPPAVHFPGLAEMGAALAAMTGLPVTAAGIIVAGVAHLVFVGVLFVCVLRTSNSPAVAGVACATYATALHYLFFSSMFLYQTAALPFFMLAIWATRRWREEGGRPFVVVAVASIAMTTVSHHVTAFALIATLLLLGVTELVTDRPRRWSALAMPAVALGVVAAWILLVARDVIGYLEEPVNQVITTVSALMTGATDPSSASAPVSLAQLVLQATGLIGLFVLYVAVGRDMVTRRDRDWWRWSALVGGAIFFAGNGVRFLGTNGPEIAGRLSTFTYIPISIIAAISLVRAVQILPSRDEDGRRWWVAPALEVPPPTGRNLVVRVLAGSALVTLLMIGARAGGWPPLGSLLPGPYVAGGFERSVDAYGVDAAEWQRDSLGPGNRVGGDVTSVSLASTYGRQDPVREVGSLYYADQWSLADDALVESLDVDYLVVDRRLGTQLPQNDAYFENDPRAGQITQPLTPAQISKFDDLADVDRLYDNGTVRIYRMGGAR